MICWSATLDEAEAGLGLASSKSVDLADDDADDDADTDADANVVEGNKSPDKSTLTWGELGVVFL